MGGELIGHRGPHEDQWTWQGTDRQPRQRPGRWRALLWAASAIGGLAAIGAAVSLPLFFVVRSDDGGPVATPIATPTPTASPTATPVRPIASPTPTPVGPIAPTSTPSGVRLRLALWGDRKSEWQFDDLAAGDSGYREGEAIPFMLRIDNAQRGAIYTVALRYDCRSGSSAAFDFLVSYERDAGTAPALAEQGPGRSPPDAAIAIPDDPGIAFDDEGERAFRLWGATFDAKPIGPAPSTLCGTDKLVLLDIRAQGDTVFLIWGAHLASSQEWGPGKGAAGQDRPFGLEVAVRGIGLEAQKLYVEPGAVTP